MSIRRSPLFFKHFAVETPRAATPHPYAKRALHQTLRCFAMNIALAPLKCIHKRTVCRHTLAALLCMGIVLNSSCVRGGSPDAFAPVQWELSTEARLNYATLLLDQSIRHDDSEGVLEAAATFLELAPLPRPMGEAAAWLMATKRLSEARMLLEKAVARSPDDLLLHLLLAETWLEEDMPANGVAIMEAYQQRHPKSDQVRQELGILLLKSKRYAEAEAQFRALPDNLRVPYVRYCHARALIMLQKPVEAVRELEVAVKVQPDFLEGWSDLARAHELAGHPDRARTVYKRLMVADPENMDYRLRAVGLEILANRPKAALEIARNSSDAQGFQITAATMFMEEKRYTEAEVLLDQLSLSLPPEQTPDEVWLLRAGLAFESQNDAEQALEWLARITPGSRSMERALRYRAQIHFASGNDAGVLETLSQARSIFPDEREFMLMEVHFHLTRQAPQQARPLLENMLERYPEDTDVLFAYGSVLDEMKQKSQALEVMERIIRLDKNHYQALNYVGYTLATDAGSDPQASSEKSHRDLVRALELLRQANSLAPDRAYIMDSLAWALYRSGELAEALKIIRHTVKLPDSDEWEIWDHYGDIAHANGQRDEARRAWKKALSFNPEKRTIIEAKIGK